MLTTLFFLLLFGFAMYGIGRPVARMGSVSLGVTLTITLGLGITLVAGGLLNRLQLGNGAVLNGYLGLGVASALVGVYPVLKNARHGIRALIDQRNWWLIWLGIAGLALFFQAVTAAHPGAFNFHDDYQKYFVHPVKLLQTGSSFGSPLSSIGKDVLGGQAFLQAFFIHNLGLAAINVFDGVFCFMLAILLLLEQGARYRVRAAGAAAALLLFFVHPQYVNISAHYSAAVFFIATLFVAHELAKSQAEGREAPFGLPLFLALAYASLVCLKTTLALYPAIHFSLFAGLMATMPSMRRAALSTAVLVPLMSLLLALPWMWHLLAAPGENELGPALLAALFEGGQGLDNLLSFRTTFYGSRPLNYTLLVLGTLLGSGLALRLYTKTPELARRAALLSIVAGGASSGIIYLIFFLLLQPTLQSFETTLRYAIPYITGIAPAILILFSLHWLRGTSRLVTKRLPMLAGMVLGALFIPSTNARLQQSLVCDSTLAFSRFACDPDYRRYNRFVLDGEAARRVRRWQAFVPEGKAMVAWIDTPFLLNFSRNPIYEVDTSGLDNPWAHFPQARYVLWQQRGFARRSWQKLRRDAATAPLYDRRIARRSLEFIRLLDRLSTLAETEILYRDRQVLLMRLGGVPEWPRQ